MKNARRVKIWNTFFKLTRDYAGALWEFQSGKKKEEVTFGGGTLDDKKFPTFAMLALCCLAIEARANHLIEELAEKGAISHRKAQKIFQLSTEKKWFILPQLAGKGSILNSAKEPHKTIKEICGWRNNIVHFKYKQLANKRLPSRRAVFLFEKFVEAMEDMNVVLGRVTSAREVVLRIGRFP